MCYESIESWQIRSIWQKSCAPNGDDSRQKSFSQGIIPVTSRLGLKVMIARMEWIFSHTNGHLNGDESNIKSSAIWDYIYIYMDYTWLCVKIEMCGNVLGKMTYSFFFNRQIWRSPFSDKPIWTTTTPVPKKKTKILNHEARSATVFWFFSHMATLCIPHMFQWISKHGLG